MLKFNFSILTRDRQKVENILIAGHDQADAERKLRQMYLHCEVTQCEIRQESARQAAHAASVEDILSMISK
ncbi:MAG TPA: hypothetical protein VMW07_04435 [Gallionella sp.]|jgi:hypothetical protein|nr:hypothetical protein [Gallionella sp.]